MKISATHKYSQSADVVYKAFCNPDFYKEKFSQVGARNVKIVEKKKQGKKFFIKTRREVPSDVPGVLKKFVGEWSLIEQSEAWAPDGRGYVNTLELNSEGVPVSIEGSMQLSDSATGSSNKIVFEIECGIPFVGSKLAAFVADDVKKTLAKEYRFIKKYLGG